jgi:hypothetical protein
MGGHHEIEAGQFSARLRPDNRIIRLVTTIFHLPEAGFYTAIEIDPWGNCQ